jgi:hypothetical protein
MVPEAGLEPAHLAAGDFEFQCDLKLGVACSPIASASIHNFGPFFSLLV